MTAPANATPLARLADAVAQHLTTVRAAFYEGGAPQQRASSLGIFDTPCAAAVLDAGRSAVSSRRGHLARRARRPEGTCEGAGQSRPAVGSGAAAPVVAAAPYTGSPPSDTAGLELGTDAWRERRREYIGASEIAILAGLHGHLSVLELYGRKMGVILEDVESPWLRHGKDFEPIIAGYYAERVGVPVYGDGRQTLVHPDLPIFGTTPDRFVGGPVYSPACERIAQIKGAGWYAAGEWGEPGTDEVPEGYLCQVTQEMAVTSAWRARRGLAPVLACDVVRFVWGQDIQVYPVAFDPELWAELRERGERFMRDHVRAGVAPALDGSAGAWTYLRSRYARRRGPMRVASASEARLVAAFDALHEKATVFKTAAELAKQRVCDAIGEDLGLTLPDGSTVKWRPQREVRVEAHVKRATRVFDRRNRKKAKG